MYRIIGRKRTVKSTISLEQMKKENSDKTFSIDEMRAEVSHEYIHWFITPAKFPHDFSVSHYILWPKRSVQHMKDFFTEETHEIATIIDERHARGYMFFLNQRSDMSVPHKIHFHFAIFRDIPHIITTE